MHHIEKANVFLSDLVGFSFEGRLRSLVRSLIWGLRVIKLNLISNTIFSKDLRRIPTHYEFKFKWERFIKY